MKFRDTTLPIAERVQDLIDQLTVEEKAGQLIMDTQPIERLGIGSYHWWNEALHGFADCGVATVFPQCIGLAASWNPEVAGMVGDIAATEGRAKNNEELAASGGNSRQAHGITIWSPNINIFRDPRWGRGQETYGEDPLLTAMMGNAFVRGLQGDHPRYLKTVATLKHYAVHSGPEPLRHTFNAVVTDKDLWDTYLPAFEDGVREAKAASVMSAYNAFDGSPCAVSRRLLTDILRDTWGFEGAVVGDVDNIYDMYVEGGNGWAESGPEAMAGAIRAGNDLRSGKGSEHALQAVEQGLLSEADVDRALTRLFTLRFRLGQFDPPEMVPWTSLTSAVIESTEHIEAAYKASCDSLVLLKNDGILPLKPDTLKTIAVIGPTADSIEVLEGNYSGTPYQPITILDGLKQKVEPLGITVVEELDIPLAAGHSTGCSPIPPGVFFTDPEATTRGLTCRMYNGSEPTGEPVIERVDSVPSIEWNTALPRPAQLTEEASCVVWSGYMKLDCEGAYTLYSRLRGKLTIEIEGQTRFPAWGKNRTRTDSRLYLLPGNAVLPVTITWRQDYVEGYFSLQWDPADGGAALERAHQRAIDTAREADVVLLTLGLSYKLEGEEMAASLEGFHKGDRTTMALPAVQQRLLSDITEIGKPVVVLLSTGSAVSFDPTGANAVMQTWYYGAQGGRAIADALLGDVNPAGRLPVTFYKSDNDLPAFEDYAMTGRTYRFFEGAPLYAFGHGLTYTTFDYANLTVARADDGLSVSLTVTNTGARESDEVVQIYASRKQPGTGDPNRWLVGFTRVRAIAPGEQRNVTVHLSNRWLALWSDDQQARVVAPGELQIAVGGASDQLWCQLTIQMD
jgi:beta-glucosidase